MKDKKGFTLIELIAVVVILSILAIIATPNIVNMIDRGKKEQYVADAKDFIAKATYMYKQEKYQKKFNNNGNVTTIKLGDIEGINDSDLTDPYGYTYDKENSIIKFEEPSDSSDVIKEREVTITLESYEKENKNDGSSCYYISGENKKNLDKTTVVHQGTVAKGHCIR